MNTSAARLQRGICRSPVAAAIASVLALAGPTCALASNNWLVTSCTDSAPGSLRAIVLAPTTLSGDTVDLNTLECPDGKLTLTSSSITIAQDSLTIVGPGKDVLQIYAAGLPSTGRVFDHEGSGTLDIRNLGLSSGHVYRYAAGQVALGGCIYSKADVSLLSVKLDTCSVTSMQDRARGGGVYTKGTLTIDQSTISGNTAYSGAGGSNGASGAGLAAKGKLTVTTSTISGNTATAPNGFGMGGGVWAGGNAVMKKAVEVIGNSVVTDHGAAGGGGILAQGTLQFDYSLLAGNSTSLANTGGGCGGAGASVFGAFSAKYSTIDSNHATGPTLQTTAGGINVSGDVTLESSTISNNTSSGIGAGLYASDNGAFDRKVFLRNSTISGNHANWIGGITSSHKNFLVYNSTIAFNTADAATFSTATFSPGVQISAFFQDIAVKFQSSIVSNNTVGADQENDFAIGQTTYSVPVTLTDSLIRASSVPLLPTNSACPLLGALRDNGGLTQSHALLSRSPVIDHGNDDLINPQTLGPYGFDQRGPVLLNNERDYARASGSHADMGAYEVQKDDIVFNTAFEGCPAVP